MCKSCKIVVLALRGTHTHTSTLGYILEGLSKCLGVWQRRLRQVREGVRESVSPGVWHSGAALALIEVQ